MKMILTRTVSVKLLGRNGSGFKKKPTVEKWRLQMLMDFVNFAVECNRNELGARELCIVCFLDERNMACFCVDENDLAERERWR